MVRTLFPIVTLVKPEHSSNALLSMIVTEFGTTILVKPEHS